jgi:hypothetical protein
MSAVAVGRKQVSEEAQAKYLEDVARAATFDDLLVKAQETDREYRSAQARNAPLAERYALATRLDAQLTAVMRAAFAAVRAEIGQLGYDDRIYRRKAMAKPRVHALNAEAQRLLTLREAHQLTGIPPRPEGIGLAPDPVASVMPH